MLISFAVLNKALLDYSFQKNEQLAKFLYDRFQEVSFSTKKEKDTFYDMLNSRRLVACPRFILIHSSSFKSSLEREPRREALNVIKDSVWDITSTNLGKPLNGTITKLSFTTVASSPQDREAAAKKLISLMKFIQW